MMKPPYLIGVAVLCLFWMSCTTHKALWIEVKEPNGQKTIAVTEGIARKLLDTREANVSFSEKGKRELVTREMLQSVLDGRERSITAQGERGSEATVSLKPLSIPGGTSGSNRLVLEIYKSGKQTFRFALPDLSIELDDEESKISVHANVDWKSWLPFLAKAGGAVYIKDHDDDSEVWVYVE
jgi:ABC-type Fe3+-hydroxamate transport system substrate-binding protein